MVFQARLFGMAVLWGSGLMLAYDCLRMFRMMIRQRKGIQAAEEAAAAKRTIKGRKLQQRQGEHDDS